MRAITFPKSSVPGEWVNAETGVIIQRQADGGYRALRPANVTGGYIGLCRPEALAEARRVATRYVYDVARPAIAAAYVEAAEEYVQRSTEADELIHLWTQNTDFSACGVNIMTTPYTFGSPERAEVTCPACVVKYETYRTGLRVELDKFVKGEPPYEYEPVIQLGMLDNGASVRCIKAACWAAGESESYTILQIMRETGCTHEGAVVLFHAETVASLADGC